GLDTEAWAALWLPETGRCGRGAVRRLMPRGRESMPTRRDGCGKTFPSPDTPPSMLSGELVSLALQQVWRMDLLPRIAETEIRAGRPRTLGPGRSRPGPALSLNARFDTGTGTWRTDLGSASLSLQRP